MCSYCYSSIALTTLAAAHFLSKLLIPLVVVASIMSSCVDPEGGGAGGPDPPEKSQK